MLSSFPRLRIIEQSWVLACLLLKISTDALLHFICQIVFFSHCYNSFLFILILEQDNAQTIEKVMSPLHLISDCFFQTKHLKAIVGSSINHKVYLENFMFNSEHSYPETHAVKTGNRAGALLQVPLRHCSWGRTLSMEKLKRRTCLPSHDDILKP